MTTRAADHSGQDLTGELTNSDDASQKPRRRKGKKSEQDGTAEYTKVQLPCPFRIENPDYYKDITINCPNRFYNDISRLK